MGSGVLWFHAHLMLCQMHRAAAPCYSVPWLPVCNLLSQGLGRASWFICLSVMWPRAILPKLSASVSPTVKGGWRQHLPPPVAGQIGPLASAASSSPRRDQAGRCGGWARAAGTDGFSLCPGCQAALDFVVEEDLKAHLTCWYIQKYVKENPLPQYLERLQP